MEVNTEHGSRQVCKKVSFSPLKPSSNKEGIILKIVHKNSPKQSQSVRNGNLTIRFTQASFNCTGNLLALHNHSGHIFVFDLIANKYWLLASMNCSLIKFSSYRPDFLFVAINNGIVYVLDANHGQVLGNLTGNAQSVIEIEFSEDKIHCATLSNSEAIVWNLDELKKVHVIPVEDHNNCLKIVKFVPFSKNILGCFHNDSIHLWNLTNYDVIGEITPSMINKTSIKTIAFNDTGELMVVAGHSSTIFVFSMDNFKLLQMVHLTKSVQSIRKVEFVRKTEKILSILLGNGSMYFYNMQIENMVGKIVNENEVWKFSLDPFGEKLACIMKLGEVLVYSLINYTKPPKQQIMKKPKSPLVLNNIQVNNQQKMDTIRKQIENVLDVGKLKGILKEFGEYPELYRKIIWTHIMQLPNNLDQYESILSNIYESPFMDFDKNYPLENKQDLRNLKRVLIAIVSWCRFFQSVSYLPNLVFPFVKFFQNEPVLAFEATIMIIVNYCQFWFEYHPLPPLNVLGIIENVLLQSDPQILTHFNKLGINSKSFAWPLLQTLFSEVLAAPQWLVFWDHIISNQPDFLLLAVVSYTTTNRATLLAMKSGQEVEMFYLNFNPFDFKTFLANTYKLSKNTEVLYHPRKFLEPIQYFVNGFYPKFDKFPIGCLELSENVSELKKEESEIDHEEKVLKIKSEELLKLKEMERRSEEFLRKSELNNLYQEKLINEQKHVNERRERLQSLRETIQNEERELLNMTKSNLFEMNSQEGKKVKSLYESNQKTQKACIEELEAVEKELLGQYTNLLKHKLKIEGLVDKNCDLDFVRKKKSLRRGKCDKTKRLQDFRDDKKMVMNQEYLKQLNMATGLSAIDSLINKVEEKISRHKNFDQLATSSKEEIQKLNRESNDLSNEISKLMQIIGHRKNA